MYIYKHLFVYSYTAKFVFDLLDVRKARFSHDEDHMSMQLLIFGVKTTGPNLPNITFILTRIKKNNAGTLND